MPINFSAAPQALGYLYQIRMALLFLLQQPDEAVLIIEGLDDIEIPNIGPGVTLHQLKHHISREASLSDTSSDLWKTLRVWSTQLADNRFDLGSSLFALTTTATANEGSIASLLRDSRARNTREAHDRLVEITTNSSNLGLEPSFDAFLGLSPPLRQVLVNAIYIFDQAPDILDCTSKIKARIRPAVRQQFVDSLYERVEGWWFAKAVSHLAKCTDNQSIMAFSLNEKIASLVEEFQSNNLPIDFLNIAPDEPIYSSLETKLFVEQLVSIGVSPKRIRSAILDYYRAFEQRSKWAREDLLIDGELEAFEAKLVDEWDRFSTALQEDLTPESSELELQTLGKKVLNWAEFDALHLRIRPKVEEDYVRRGSFHILADKTPRPSIYWHPKFLERLETLLLPEES